MMLSQSNTQRTFQDLSPLSPLPCAPSTSQSQGNIEALKDCPLTSLNLFRCKKLEGMTFGWCTPLSYQLNAMMRPQGLVQRTFLGTFFISPHLFPPPPLYSPGNIEVFEGMQIKELNLQQCHELEGRSPTHLLGAGSDV